MSDMSDWNRKVIEDFRANDGEVGGQFQGAPLLLLHTKGAKTGTDRVNPIMYLDLDGRRFVFASKAGADTSPDWYHNLIAHPDVTVEVGKETYSANAAPVTGADRGQVGQVCANIRGLRPPDPYKQKGIRITGERLKKKAGKAGAATKPGA